MAKWIEVIEVADLKPDQLYFLGRKPYEGSPHPVSMFYSQGLNGKRMWSVKPGIGLKFKGNEEFINILADNPTCCAVKVPADYATRWKARQKRY